MRSVVQCHPGRRHDGRGLCSRCHRRAARTGELIDHPRRTWRAEDLAAEAQLLINRHGGLVRPRGGHLRGGHLRGVRPEGITLAEVAAQLGVSRAALEQARRRAKKRKETARGPRAA